MLINRYSTFVRDIEPLGFDLIVMNGYLTREVVSRVREVLEDADRRAAMVRQNYAVASRHFAYGVLQDQLEVLLKPFFGPTPTRLRTPERPLAEKARPPEPIAATGA